MMTAIDRLESAAAMRAQEPEFMPDGDRCVHATCQPRQPLLVRFIGMEDYPALETIARRRADWLKRFYPGLLSWRVSVEALDKQGTPGRRHGVRIDAAIAGHAVRVDRVREGDAHVVLRDAFSDMRRALQDALGRDQGRARDPFPRRHCDAAHVDVALPPRAAHPAGPPPQTPQRAGRIA